MKSVNLSYSLRAGSRLRDLSVWHAVDEGAPRTIYGLEVPNSQARRAWDETTPEPRCRQCVSRMPVP